MFNKVILTGNLTRDTEIANQYLYRDIFKEEFL